MRKRLTDEGSGIAGVRQRKGLTKKGSDRGKVRQKKGQAEEYTNTTTKTGVAYGNSRPACEYAYSLQGA